MEILDDLEAEYDRIEALLAPLNTGQWDSPSAAIGWSISDVVLHLAQSEELVVNTITGNAPAGKQALFTPDRALSMDEMMHALVVSQRTTPAAAFQRWKAARRALGPCPRYRRAARD